MNERGILIVDDDNPYRKSLLDKLESSYRIVAGAPSGEEAIDIVSKRPHDFQFAVIDHLLGSGLDGIDTTRELVKISPNLYPVIFSNIRADSSLKEMEFKYKALAAGAYRYLEWSIDHNKDIEDFVQEIDQLERLRDWIAGFFEARATAPSLLTQLDVGMDIIDQHYKVWFMNDAMRRIFGVIGPGLPKAPCSHWHGITCYPCAGCCIKPFFDEPQISHDNSEQNPRISLMPLVFRDDRKVFFSKSWAQPVVDQYSNVVLAPNGKPLAIMESICELTDSPELKALPLNERLGYIAKALYYVNKERYSTIRRFAYARIYIVGDTSEQFILKAAIGTPKPAQLNVPIDLRIYSQHLKKADAYMKATGLGHWFGYPSGFDPVAPGEQRMPYIYWPIIENQKTIALLEVGGVFIEKNTLEEVRPYANEILYAIKDDRNRGPAYEAEVVKSMAEVDFALQTNPRSAVEQLKEIVLSACELTDSFQYVLRFREVNDAKLLRLKIPDYCEYESQASTSYPLSHMQSWSCRTIMAGVETVVNTAEHGAVICGFRNNLNERTQKTLKDVHSLCYEPLIFEGTCIGSLGFHSRIIPNYDDKKRAIIRALAKRATMSLHDYRIAEEIREKTEGEASSEVLGLVLHNIKSPLATVRYSLDLLLSDFRHHDAIIPTMQKHIDSITDSLSEISQVSEAVLKLKKPWESRIEIVNFSVFLLKVVDSIVDGDINLTTDYSIDTELKTVYSDKSAIKLCLEVLLQNAVDELKNKDGGKNLEITLRKATPEENGKIESALNGIAIDIVDNGAGVSPDIAMGLFKKMKSGKVDGMGMGLLHSYAVARSAQGIVLYDDNHKPGAKFILVMPYKKEGD